MLRTDQIQIRIPWSGFRSTLNHVSASSPGLSRRGRTSRHREERTTSQRPRGESIDTTSSLLYMRAGRWTERRRAAFRIIGPLRSDERAGTLIEPRRPFGPPGAVFSRRHLLPCVGVGVASVGGLGHDLVAAT